MIRASRSRLRGVRVPLLTALCLPLTWLAGAATQSTPGLESRQATGVKVGEVTDRSALIWTRVTAGAGRRADGIVRRGMPKPFPAGLQVADLEGECPGAPGRVRVRYGEQPDLETGRSTRWAAVNGAADFTHVARLSGLKPATRYYFAAETTGPGGTPKHAALRGEFTTAPDPGQRAPITGAVMTCQAYRDLDHPDGFHIYDSMHRLRPNFLVAAGDLVYYDSDDPRATTPALARYHWHRMYSLPLLLRFHLFTPTYFAKDDHDTHSDDAWPGRNNPLMGEFTFPEGQAIFREQAPMAKSPFRTFRWGKTLQIWLTEGRDFRSPNTLPDGDAKTIWGAEQKAWLKKTLLESDAEWKLLISPTPLVGPDRPRGKNDNHSNAAFQSEGVEIRRWFQEKLPDRLFVINGDRHWQYHSVHPETGLHEFSCGPASDEHAGGSPGEDRRYHRFHRVKGGFLTVTTETPNGQSRIRFRFHDVRGNVVYEFQRELPVRKPAG